MQKDHPEYQSERKKALELSDLFTKFEGRRPRILVAGLDMKTARRLHVICSSLADIGYNVDLAPKISYARDYATQCLENDVDILLIIGEKAPEAKQLKNIQDAIFLFRPDVILALAVSESGYVSNLEKGMKWVLFDHTIKAHLMGLKLLDSLLSS